MSILIDEKTKIIIQGMTGNAGSFHAKKCIEYGSNVVAGVTPKKGGTQLFGIPIFDTVCEAKNKVDFDASLIFVPPKFAADSILEAKNEGTKIIVCITEGIPVHDMIAINEVITNDKNCMLIGPNCPGIISPGKCKMGIMPGYIHKRGNVGVISRSGTLTYEAVWQMTQLGIGQSTCIGIGGDEIIGSDFLDILKIFNDDEDTKAILMIGEIGGSSEEDAALWIKDNGKKPVAAFVAGTTAPPGKRMGHAGAIISATEGTAKSKIDTFKNCGIKVVETADKIGTTMAELLENTI